MVISTRAANTIENDVVQKIISNVMGASLDQDQEIRQAFKKAGVTRPSIILRLKEKELQDIKWETKGEEEDNPPVKNKLLTCIIGEILALQQWAHNERQCTSCEGWLELTREEFMMYYDGLEDRHEVTHDSPGQAISRACHARKSHL
jgi:hypothetical protein